MHAHQDPQQRGGTGERERDGGEAGAQDGEADGQSGGEGGVVAGEGPVAGFGALGDGVGAAHGAAGAFLVDDELQRLADGVGGDGADAGEHGRGDAVRVARTEGGPPGPQEEGAEEHQGSLGGEFEEAAEPGGAVRHGFGEGAVEGDGGAVRDPRGARVAGSAGGQQPEGQGREGHQDRGEGRRGDRREGGGRSTSGGGCLSCFSSHDGNVERRAAGSPSRRSGCGYDEGQA
ncbi:hypothetical protein GCM10009801_25730 [Streptomyces albiaxialis]|uniref:Uncharacterized protein n=1 Tax=Streptomyces albiaxialis TaxID=329523 RepID=A0ABN2VU63_9ACTN